MEQSKNTKKRKKNVSCLGALLIFCMLLLSGITLFANLGFRENHMVSFGKNVFYYNTSDDMEGLVSKYDLAIGKKTDQIDADKVVLYQSTAGDLKLGLVSLIMSSDSTAEGISDVPTYYLTKANSASAVAVSPDSIIAVCQTKDATLGAAIKFLTDKTGILVGLIAPSLILLLYVMAIMAMAREKAADDEEDDDDTDLAFVKSIQERKKVQQTAEFAKVSDTEKEPAKAEKPAVKQSKYSEEEMAAMEEKEAAERAERIAAIRSRMENRQKTEMPDNVPLFTTEFIAKTHTMSIPKAATADAMANSAKQNAIKKEKTAEFPRDAFEKTAAKAEKTAEASRASAPVKTLADAPSMMEKTEKSEHAAERAAALIDALPVAEKTEKKEETALTTEERAQRKAENAKKIVSASYEDLMKFLNDENSKL